MMSRTGFRKIGGVGALLLLAFLSGCAKKESPLPPTGSAGLAAGPAAANDAVSVFTLVGHTETGRKKWEIQGQTADLLGEVVQLAPVAAKSFGKVEVALTARQGRYHKATEDVYLKKEVVVTTSDGIRLDTDSLKWVARQEFGRTWDRVRVTQSGMTVTGLGGIAFPKLKRVRMERKVVVALEGKEGMTVVTCDGPMEVDYGRRKARFWRNVWVRDLQGFIRSDRMDLLLHPKENRIQEARFWGHVRIDRENQRATAQRAIWWGFPKRTRLMGHTRMVVLAGEVGIE